MLQRLRSALLNLSNEMLDTVFDGGDALVDELFLIGGDVEQGVRREVRLIRFARLLRLRHLCMLVLHHSTVLGDSRLHIVLDLLLEFSLQGAVVLVVLAAVRTVHQHERYDLDLVVLQELGFVYRHD